jgi:hypothetical protein
MTTIREWLVSLLGMLLVIITPIKSVMLATGFLVLVDFVTGVWASSKRGEPITSEQMKRSVAKSVLYIGGIVLFHVTERYMIDGVPLVKTISALIALVEIKSFLENVHTITGVDYWSMILDKVQGVRPDIKLPNQDDKK